MMNTKLTCYFHAYHFMGSDGTQSVIICCPNGNARAEGQLNYQALM